MIPEWKDYFDMDAAKAFTEAVKTHDPAKSGKLPAEWAKPAANVITNKP